jgi:hypothetical protein
MPSRDGPNGLTTDEGGIYMTPDESLTWDDFPIGLRRHPAKTPASYTASCSSN